VKLIRQIRLRSVQGTTQAVFEIDLCELGPDRFVVNFRYGKQGKRLTDGTKTTLPVRRVEADRVVASLIRERRKKGYVDASAPVGGLIGAPPASTTPARSIPTPAPTITDPRAAIIVGLLQYPRTCRPSFPLHRVVWRAGELRIPEAAPALRNLLLNGDRALKVSRHNPPWRYALVWALARCQDPANIPVLAALHADTDRSPTVRRIAELALSDHLSGSDAQAFADQVQARLPNLIADAITACDIDALRTELALYLKHGPEDRHDVLYTLYLHGLGASRAMVLEQLKTIPLRRPGFRAVRRIFKAAELRGDGEVFGVVAHRFETTRAGDSWAPRSEKAYLPATRVFFRRRVWRTLRRLGEVGSPEYIDLAMGVLLAFSDDDTTGPNGDGLARLWCLAQILYRGHPQVRVNQRSLSVTVPAGSRGAVRAEAYPQLWDTHPEALVTLMVRSACGPVHQFAAAAFRALPAEWGLVGNAPLIAILGQAYETTVALGVDLAITRHNAARPDRPVIAALANCMVARGRKQAQDWISANPREFFADVGFTAGLILSPHADTRAFVRRALGSTLVTSADGQQIVAHVLAALLSGERDAASTSELLGDVGPLLLTEFASVTRGLSVAVIGDLLEHPLESVQGLGVALLLAHDTRPADLPAEVLAAPMLSAHASVRAAGVQLFGGLPDATLLERRAVLVDLCLNPHHEVRQAASPIIGRLGRQHPEFAEAVLVALIDALNEPEAQDGLHAEAVALIRRELQAALGHVALPPIWKLLQAPSSAAQELGGLLLERNVAPAELEVWRVAKLASHDILSVRHAAWEIYRQSVPRLRSEMAAAVLILDAKWEDSREFAFDFFGQHFGAEELTPKLLVSICDSVRPDVQQFGRGLVTRFFADADGATYLLELSQHPVASMQLFATNYLEQFASRHPARVLALRPYFATVLAGINKGRVAKKRVLSFLQHQAALDAQVAEMAAALVSELSLTISVEYKAAAIEILNEIRVRHPEVPVPLTLRSPPTRGRRAV